MCPVFYNKKDCAHNTIFFIGCQECNLVEHNKKHLVNQAKKKANLKWLLSFLFCLLNYKKYKSGI